MHPVGFETTILAGRRPQTQALDRAASGTGPFVPIEYINFLSPHLRTQQIVSLIQTSLHVSGYDDCYRMTVDIDRHT